MIDKKPSTMKSTMNKSVKELIFASLNSIAYIRNAFHDDVFTDYQFQSDTNVLTLKRVERGRSKRSDEFIDIIEEGVFRAIDNKLISGLQLAFSLDNLSDLLEVYLFEFDYRQGNIGLQGFGAPFNLTSKSMYKLIRKLIIITQTFNPLPRACCISIKLLFKENYPSSFQPKGFKNDYLNRINFFGDNDFNHLGNAVFGEEEIGLRVISNVGKDIYKGEDIDPFSLINNDEERFSSFFHKLTFPESMESDLVRIKNEVEQFMNKFISDSIDPEHEEILSCECGLTHQYLDGDVFKCQECGNLLHMSCYAQSRGNFIPIKCISCRHQLMELEDILKLRAIYKIVSTKGVSLNEVVDLDDELTISIINFLFKTNNFLTTSEFTFENDSDSYNCINTITPPSNKFIDNKGLQLERGKTYNFIFAPIGCKYFDIRFLKITEFIKSEDHRTIDKFHQFVNVKFNSSRIVSHESYLASQTIDSEVESTF